MSWSPGPSCPLVDTGQHWAGSAAARRSGIPSHLGRSEETRQWAGNLAVYSGPSEVVSLLSVLVLLLLLVVVVEEVVGVVVVMVCIKWDQLPGSGGTHL